VAWLRGGKTAIAVALFLAGGGLGIVVACLPDLERSVNAVPTDAGPPPCGNGLIDWEAGEQCDPATDAAVPGCKHCKIDCPGMNDGALPSYVDPASDHCYFVLPLEAGADPEKACAVEKAHVITLGSPQEVSQVVDTPGAPPLLPPRRIESLWLGLVPNPHEDGGEITYSSVVDEPGLGRACPGCFGARLGDHGLAPVKGESADAGCVSWVGISGEHWYATSCDANLATICEREPVGSRSTNCNGAPCFTVPLTAPGKTYLWSPTPTSAEGGAEYCAELSDAGKASLVVFSAGGQAGQEEREQVFYQLLHLPNTAGIVPTAFWIGLTLSPPPQDGGSTLWVWDDGRSEDQYPLQWGDHEPKTTQLGARAFALQTSTAYGVPAATYDTQLAHARDPDAGDGGPETHSVLCQILR
jgi:hypothetical protein